MFFVPHSPLDPVPAADDTLLANTLRRYDRLVAEIERIMRAAAGWEVTRITLDMVANRTAAQERDMKAAQAEVKWREAVLARLREELAEVVAWITAFVYANRPLPRPTPVPVELDPTVSGHPDVTAPPAPTDTPPSGGPFGDPLRPAPVTRAPDDFTPRPNTPIAEQYPDYSGATDITPGPDMPWPEKYPDYGK